MEVTSQGLLWGSMVAKEINGFGSHWLLWRVKDYFGVHWLHKKVNGCYSGGKSKVALKVALD
jgi:hypothetical protein